jgi:hypothetical protein
MIEFIDSFSDNHSESQLQELIIRLQPKPSSLTAEDSLHSLSCSATQTDCSLGIPRYIAHGKYRL